jgi:hypothetical protein
MKDIGTGNMAKIEDKLTSKIELDISQRSL